jgi:hypothetical protein
MRSSDTCAVFNFKCIPNIMKQFSLNVVSSGVRKYLCDASLVHNGTA